MTRARRLFAVLAVAVAAFGAEQGAMAWERGRPDPDATEDFAPSGDDRESTLRLSDGSEIHVTERGSGPPLLLLHGVTLSTVTWHYQQRELSATHRVIAIDHRGHGRSTGEAGTFTIDRLADDLAEIIEQLDLRNAVVVGHSMGGMTLMKMATDHPELVAERCAGLVLMSTDAGPGSIVPGWALVSRVVTPVSQRYLRLAGRLPGGLLPSTDLSYLLARLGFGRGPSPTHVELTRVMTGAVPAPIVAEFWGSIARFNVGHALDRIGVPTLVFVGSRDAMTPVRHSRHIAERVPGAELEILPGAGHMMMLERHAEVSDRLARFADSVQ
ncbi:MAG: hypothetical protein QOG03_819 [Actinomycetota bacterium]|jgi:pimeloyl-ACP methyl ester carboxylesterase|nr:hypothetical protein [Actinomycetota bacterium]